MHRKISSPVFTNVTANKGLSANKQGESQECSFDQEVQKADNAREKQKHSI